ncbi:DUF4179 domain-containing protein [Clostridium sp.]|uniref:DUF4179 domain-containing protein n=1 Tax=Clostridium sp. TaxID=1506 RepID=UPI003520B71B
MDNNIKEMIKIPKELDNAVLKGFEMGKREKKKEKQKLIFKRSAIAAGVIAAGTTMAGIINPDIVSAIPIVGDVFEYFNYGVYKQASNKYEELGDDVNITVEDKGVKVTINKVVLDDNILLASLLIESDKFIGYDESRSPQDFLNMDLNVLINGEMPSSCGPKVTIVNESTAAAILEVNVSDIDLGNEVNIDLDINNFTRGRKTLAKGSWDFNIKTIKGSESNIYEVNKSLNLINEEINIEKLVVTPLNNRLIFSGITSDYENFRVDENKFIVRDNNGKILLLDLTSGNVSNNGEYKYSYNILNDLSNTEYIEIIKASGNNVIGDENGYLLKASAIDETNANRINDIISRKPTKEELNDGYALSSVNYNVDIDKSVAFETIDSLIDKEIAINNTDKIIVKEIVPHDDYTEVVMKIDGNYNYRLLSSIVLFDEDMNDSCAFEGSTAIMNDIEEKIVTVKLTKIDPSKKYTIAIPVTTDLVIDENEKATINLK